MNHAFAAFVEMKKMVSSLDKWLEKSIAHAKSKGFDPNVFMQARLAPDQYPLVRQIQSVCDGPKFFAARLTGKEAPKHPDTETTMDEARARIRTVLAHLDTIKESDFAEADKREITLPFLEGKALKGADFVHEMAIPNFYFHLVTAYAILRHNGVDVGKMDYIGGLTTYDK